MPDTPLGVFDTEIKKTQFLLTLEIHTFQLGSETNLSFKHSMINNKTEVYTRKRDTTEQGRSDLVRNGEMEIVESHRSCGKVLKTIKCSICKGSLSQRTVKNFFVSGQHSYGYWKGIIFVSNLDCFISMMAFPVPSHPMAA